MCDFLGRAMEWWKRDDGDVVLAYFSPLLPCSMARRE